MGQLHGTVTPVTMTNRVSVSVICLFIFMFHYNDALFFGINRSPRQQNLETSTMGMSSSLARQTLGWGWSEWGQWAGSCPQACPVRCRVRERYCSGLCGAGQPIDLSDCPELQAPDQQDETTNNQDNNPFV